jgi:hypothetical protein
MSSYFDDRAFIEAVEEKGRPGASPWDTLYDVDWANIFARWADTEQLGVDEQGAAQAMKYYAQGNSLRDLRGLVVDSDAPFAVQWPADVTMTLERVHNGMASEQDGKDAIYRSASNILEPHWGRFLAFVDSVLAQSVSAPTPVATSAANLDLAVVDGINQKNLKDLPAGGYLYFWQKGGVILLGEGHPASYYEWAGGYETGYRGTVTMSKKGGLLDSGKVFVAGSPDEDAFDAALARFSKKKVTHGPYEEDDEEAGGAQGGGGQPSGGFQARADWLAQQVGQQLGLNLTWSEEYYAGWQANADNTAMRNSYWPELTQAMAERDESPAAAWDLVEQLARGQGWIG